MNESIEKDKDPNAGSSAVELPADDPSSTTATHPPVDDAAYRAVMRRWASGVTVITMLSPEGPHGMTASAFTSVSIDPPLIMIVVDKRWRSHDLIAEAGAFCVNILAAGQVPWSDRFAGRHGDLPDRFFDVPTTVAVTGAPCFTDAQGYLDCEIVSTHDAGDHTIFMGGVRACATSDAEAAPLTYHDGHYRALGEILDEEF
jgi:flavin reductase (DIM6/NTAB) family NADH-FMN oxidoreductase RutF